MTGDTSKDVRRRAGWLPTDQGALEEWLRGKRERVAGQEDRPLAPSVQAFRELIEGDAVLRMHAHQMIEQVPQGRQYSERHLESVDEMLRLIDDVLRTAPEFGQGTMVATPLDGVFDWAKATPAGFAFFRDPRVNDALRGILDAWSSYLSSPDSLGVIDDSPSGWKSEAAQQATGMQQYQYDPDDEHWGFTSWNDFFTRRFRDGERPVAGEGDDRVVASPVEATPYRIANDVQRRDEFWAKGEPYSLEDMLAGDPSVEAFVGGTVFQAFLSAVDYHRWHSPVAGTVVRAWVQPGTYFSEADAQGASAAEVTLSQGYMAHVATRAIVLLDAGEAGGLVALVFIGMSDVSSCVIADAVTPGARVDKGDELGFFQFGGSTACVVFEPGRVEAFSLAAIPQAPDEAPALMHVRSHLATFRAR